MGKMDEFYDKVPDDILDKVMPLYGQLMSSVANNNVGREIVKFSHTITGKAIGGLLSMTGAAGEDTPVEAVRGFVEKFFGEITEIDEEASGDDELVFSFDSCPYGFCDEEVAELCHCAMNLEEEIVEGLGGELVIEERIAEGAEKCKFRVLNF